MNSVRSNNLKLHLIIFYCRLRITNEQCTHVYNVHTMYCTADVLELYMHRRYNEVLMNGLWHCTVWKRQLIALHRDRLETVLYCAAMYIQCIVNKRARYCTVL